MLEKINIYLTPVMVILLLATGFYLSFGTRFFQLRRLGQVLSTTIGSLFSRSRKKKTRDGITPFQAVSTALAGTLGTGNIVGVATAIVSGGPGAIFWMIVSAFFGMITKYAEVLLAIEYQIKDRSGILRGGPMYYMKNGLQMPRLAALFAVVCLLASFGVGNMVQSHSVAEALNAAFGLSKPLVGLAVAVIVSLAAFSGIRSIAKFCEKLVPFMALFYLGACLFAIGVNAERLPEAVSLIMTSAFRPRAAGGGVLGYTVSNAIRFGVTRGIFTNEAGLGSAPIAHGSAEAESSVKQGMWGIFEVFFDTVVMCTLTTLVILTSGLWDSGLNGAALTTAAFSSATGRFATGFIAVSVLFFAVSSILGWYCYGSGCLAYLSSDKRLLRLYQLLFFLAAAIGSVVRLPFVWALSDTLNLMMLLPNTAAILLLSKTVFRRTKEWEQVSQKQQSGNSLCPDEKNHSSGSDQNKIRYAHFVKQNHRAKQHHK